MPPRIGAPAVSQATDAALLLSLGWWRGAATPAARAFSSTPCRERMTRARYRMHKWLNSREGRSFAESGRGVNYLGSGRNQPFPLNPLFRSEPVLDDETKEIVWKKVKEDGEPLRTVSAEMSIDVRRVAAVVRLKEVEKQWEKKGTKLATAYSRAIMNMLPKTSWRPGQKNVAHEPINDIHVHKQTMRQLFLPVSESRHFTREDAAKAFDKRLLTVDQRSPQPLLIDMERDMLQGKSREESIKRFKERSLKQDQALARRVARQQQREKDATTKVVSGRFEFRFTEINADDAGFDGKSPKATGWRYGAPLMDRKAGASKIPTTFPCGNFRFP